MSHDPHDHKNTLKCHDLHDSQKFVYIKEGLLINYGFFPTYQSQQVHFFGIRNEATREGSNDTSRTSLQKSTKNGSKRTSLNRPFCGKSFHFSLVFFSNFFFFFFLLTL